MKNIKIKRIKFFIKIIARLIRFQNLIILALSQYFVGVFLIGKEKGKLTVLTDPDLFIISLSTVLVAAGGYVINDYYDVKIDIINKPQRVLVGRYLKRRIAIAGHFVLTILGILAGAYVHWKIGAINLICAFLLWLYSNHLKKKPFSGNFTIAFLTSFAVYLPALYYKENQMIVGVYALFAFFISLAREILKDMEDIKGDSSFGCKTLPIVLGIRKTKSIIYFTLGVFVLFLFLFFDQMDLAFVVSMIVLVIVPIIYLIIRLIAADTVKDFHNLSTLCKFIMLTGVVSMIFI